MRDLVLKLLIFAGTLLVLSQSLNAQALPTATRALTFEVGAGVLSANSGIETARFRGFFVFATADLPRNLGLELTLRQLNSPYANDQIYERTYEIGPRLHHRFGRLDPYLRPSIGRGIFNYPSNEANLAYNLYALGGGADIILTRHLRLRADYEYQHWINFYPGTLNPTHAGIGAAYRF